MRTPPLTDILAAIVRGETPPWPYGADLPAEGGFLHAARGHGLHVLAASRLREPAFAGWPQPLRAACDRVLLSAFVVEHVQREELRPALVALANAGIGFLLFKGTPLAYTHYPEPWLRPRVDTDLLVAEGDVPAVRRALETLGYARSPLVDGSLVMRQAEYVKDSASGIKHSIDVHWRTGNPQLVADLWSFDELSARAVPVPALGEAARTPCAEHALLIACVHHVAHHAASPRLIWRYDAHLLAGAMTADELRSFARTAVAKRVARLCASELETARATFGTRLAADARELDAIFAGAMPDEPSALYLGRASRPAQRLLVELRVLPTWRTRARLLGQHLFPSPAYMRGAYGRTGRAILPALYAHRILTGVWSWFRRSAA